MSASVLTACWAYGRDGFGNVSSQTAPSPEPSHSCRATSSPIAKKWSCVPRIRSAASYGHGLPPSI